MGAEYNSDRPHQALDHAVPGGAVRPGPEQERELLELWVPPALAARTAQRGGGHRRLSPAGVIRLARWSSSGWCRSREYADLPGSSSGSVRPRRTVVRFWADCE